MGLFIWSKSLIKPSWEQSLIKPTMMKNCMPWKKSLFPIITLISKPGCSFCSPIQTLSKSRKSINKNNSLCWFLSSQNKVISISTSRETFTKKSRNSKSLPGSANSALDFITFITKTISFTETSSQETFSSRKMAFWSLLILELLKNSKKDKILPGLLLALHVTCHLNPLI